MKCIGWELIQDSFDVEASRKYEAVMCLGNGYMGVRASDEERYPQSWQFTLVSGMYDKYGNEATEIANCADTVSADIFVNGDKLDLNTGVIDNYSKKLCLENGLLTRSFIWQSPSGAKIAFESRRFVSLDNLHLICAKTEITALTDDVDIEIKTGIFGDRRCGEPHFTNVNMFDSGCLNYVEKTNESGIVFAISSSLMSSFGTVETVSEGQDILYDCKAKLKKGETFASEKKSMICTSRDLGNEDKTTEYLTDMNTNTLLSLKGVSFEELFSASVLKWKKLWSDKDVVIDADDPFYLFAVRFAIYHLTVMDPAHDGRMNIGAKGISGPGYRGHFFWDTEIYMLPFYIFEDPSAAKALVTSRYNGLDGARRKAAENGYSGAMFPWEAAWVTDSEVTPVWARTGMLEHHITADVAQGVYYYYSVTCDEDFMNRYGYEIVFDTAVFWQSRVSYCAEKDRYEINCVIGPDEFREDVDNNAYTNYMAWFNMKLAMEYYKKIENTPLFASLSEKLGLEGMYDRWTEVCSKIYLPSANEDGIVPQDDKYLLCDSIDMTPYKAGGKNFFGETTEEQRRNLQYSKQADVMVLFLLLEDLFDAPTKKKNFYYYESRCLHCSSLSLSSYSMLAADIYEKETAYNLFNKACHIDLNEETYGSVDGIHAASLGGIWQCAVLGFLGVRLYGKKLRIQPDLPEKWNGISANIWWQGQKLSINADKNTMRIRRLTGDKPVTFICQGKEYTFEDSISVGYGAKK